MTTEQILTQCQHAWPKWKREQFPKFIFESGIWYAHEFSNNSGSGNTILESLYFHVNLMATSDTETGADASQWNPVLEILVQHVADPLIMEMLNLNEVEEI